jgi:two-component system CheB/CheR fusion protein
MMIHDVIDTMTTKDSEVEDHEGRLFALRVRPYKNVESRLDGAVLTLFDVSNIRERTEDQRVVQAALDTGHQHNHRVHDLARSERARDRR